MVITIITSFDLSGRISESVEQIWKGCFEFWLKEKKIPLFLSFFCTPTNLATWHGQSQCEVAFLRYSHTPPHLSWGQVPTAVSWTHGVIFFWMTSCGGTVTALHDVALIDISKLYLFIFCLLLYIYIYTVLYIGSLWSAVKRCLSWLVPVVHNVTDWLVDYNWKWPLTLCAIVPCALVMFYFLLWGSCVWMYCIFLFLYFFTFTSTVFFFPSKLWFFLWKTESLQKGPFSPAPHPIDSCLVERWPRWPYVCVAN